MISCKRLPKIIKVSQLTLLNEGMVIGLNSGSFSK
jgi:hypothetical protein